jgi:hypothetical protein
MNTDSTMVRTRLDDALYALSQARPAPDAAALEKLVRLYPEHARELTTFAIELALDALDEDVDCVVETPSAETNAAVLDAMSHFHNQLYAVRQAKEHNVKPDIAASVANSFAALDRQEMRSLGARLHANTVFVMKLRDRLIAADTMTIGFKQRLAEEIRAPFEAVLAYFSGGSVVSAPAYYRSDQKPQVGEKQSFEEAVRSSGLTSEQQSYLLSL